MKKILILLTFVLFLTGCELNYEIDDPSLHDDESITMRDVEYSSNATTYINTVRKKVSTTSIALFDEKAVYLIPVGNNNSSNCSGIDEENPYGAEHIYAYVGVVKRGSTYLYYYVSRDSLGNGYNFTDQKTVEAKGKGISKGDKLYNYSYLAKTYNQKGSAKDSLTTLNLSEIDVNDSIKDTLGSYLNIEKVKIYTYSVCG